MTVKKRLKATPNVRGAAKAVVADSAKAAKSAESHHAQWDEENKKRDSILFMADQAVNQRGVTYGESKTDNFQDIADMWSVILRDQLTAPVTPLQVASCMIGVKQMRLIKAPMHVDSMVDIAGYAECMYKMLREQQGVTSGLLAEKYQNASSVGYADSNPNVNHAMGGSALRR